jgi:hypothetical protein
MKPYLIISKTRYAHAWSVEDFATREEAADRAARAERDEKIVAARLLNLRIELEEAPEWVEPESAPAAAVEAAELSDDDKPF